MFEKQLSVERVAAAGPQDTVESAAHAGGDDQSRVAFAGLVALTVAPLIAAALSLVGRHWHPASDLAIQLLQIDDVGGRHTPLTGVHSRYGWDHPGPLLLWLLAPFDWLFGTTGVLFGVVLLNIAAVLGALLVARRRGGLALTGAVAALLLVLMLANDTDLFVNPWNPWVAVLPFLTFVLLGWSLADGDVVALPWLVGVGTFVVQSHVGYAPLVLGVVLIAGPMAWYVRRGTSDDGRLRPALLVAVVTGFVLWLPPLVQQLASGEGNLTSIIEFFRHPPEARAGWRLAWGIMGTELGPPGAWLGGDELGPYGVAPGSTLSAIGLLILALGLGTLAYRRGARSAGRLALLVVGSCLVGVVATSRITGVIGTYLVRWWWVLAGALWLSIIWSAVGIIGGRARGALLGIAIVASIILSTVATIRAVPVGLPDAVQGEAVAALADDLTNELDRDAAYVFEWTDAELWGAVGIGVFVDLVRRGYDVAAIPWWAPTLGSWRTARPEDVDGRLLVIGSSDVANGVVPPAGALAVARFDAPDGEDYAIYLTRS